MGCPRARARKGRRSSRGRGTRVGTQSLTATLLLPSTSLYSGLVSTRLYPALPSNSLSPPPPPRPRYLVDTHSVGPSPYQTREKMAVRVTRRRAASREMLKAQECRLPFVNSQPSLQHARRAFFHRQPAVGGKAPSLYGGTS